MDLSYLLGEKSQGAYYSMLREVLSKFLFKVFFFLYALESTIHDAGI